MEQCDLIKARPNGIFGRSLSQPFCLPTTRPAASPADSKGIAHGNSIAKTDWLMHTTWRADGKMGKSDEAWIAGEHKGEEIG